MAANANQNTGKRFFKLIAKADKGNQEKKQVICEQRKNGDNYEVVGWYSSLSGFLTAINTKEVTFEGRKSKIVSLELTDSQGVCTLDFSFSNASFSIINSLLGLDFSKEVEISAWIKDGKYVNTAVKYTDGSKANWAIEIKDQPKPAEFEHPITKKMEKDFTNVTTFWINKLESIKGKAVKGNFTGVIQSPAPVASSEPQPIGKEHEDSGLPF